MGTAVPATVALSFGDVLIRILGYGVLVASGLLILWVVLYALRFPPSVKLVAKLRARRTRRHQRAASALGLEYAQEDDSGLLDLPLSLMSWGMKRWIHQVTYGTYRGRWLRMFHLYYTVPGGKYGPTMVRRRGAVVEIDAAFPHVVIEHRTVLEAKQWIRGLEELHLDPEFDEAYRVRSTDPEFTADLLDANVRRWMLGLDKQWRFEVSGPWVLAYEEGGGKVDERGMVDMVSDFADRIPWILTQQRPAGSAPDPDPLRVGPPPPTEEQQRKLRSRGRTIAWLAGVILLLVVGGIVVALLPDEDTSGTPDVSVPPPSINVPSFEPPSIPPVSIPPFTTAPGPTPTLTAERDEALALAGIQEGEEVTVTFLGLQPHPHPSIPAGATPPKKDFIGARFLIENTGTIAYEDFPANGIELVDADGREYSPSLLDAYKPRFGTIHLEPGERVAGSVTFEFPTGAQLEAVLFTTDSSFGPQTGRWTL
jgi:hypothetical protein